MKKWIIFIPTAILCLLILSFFFVGNFETNKILANNENFIGTKLIIKTTNKCSIEAQDGVITNNLVKWGYSNATSYKLDPTRILVKIPNLLASDIIYNVTSDINKSTIEFKKNNNGKLINSDININDIKSVNILADKDKKFYVNIVFTPKGKQKFAELTNESIGMRLGIFIDGEIITAPKINEPIVDGVAQISGGAEGFTEDEALYFQDLINCIKYPSKIIAKKTFY